MLDLQQPGLYSDEFALPEAGRLGSRSAQDGKGYGCADCRERYSRAGGLSDSPIWLPVAPFATLALPQDALRSCEATLTDARTDRVRLIICRPPGPPGATPGP